MTTLSFIDKLSCRLNLHDYENWTIARSDWYEPHDGMIVHYIIQRKLCKHCGKAKVRIVNTQPKI